MKQQTIYLAQNNENFRKLTSNKIKNIYFAFSFTGTKIIVRMINEKDKYKEKKVNLEFFEIAKIKNISTVLPSFQKNKLFWEKYLKELNTHSFNFTENEIYQISINTALNDPELSKKIVIKTELRKYYESLKKKIIVKNLKSLISLFTQAIKMLENYDNLSNKYPNEEKRKKNRKQKKGTIKVQEFFEKTKDLKFNKENKKYKYLCREINFLRTPNGITNDGRSAKPSGSGGVDVLCVNENNEVVIIEYKSKSDSDLYYALVQVLTYASEALTQNQMKRLQNEYKEIKSNKVEICILYDFDKQINNNIFKFSRELYNELNEYISKITFVRLLNTRKDSEYIENDFELVEEIC